MEYELNKIYTDDFGRKSGVLAIDKPAGKTSHDIVYAVRKSLNTPKVGHAGALDPAATGLLIVLIGKATKQSDDYLNLGKEYLADILFGISTDSADREGKVLRVQQAGMPANLDITLSQFTPEYKQYVPIFSSVKVDGEKLRVRARKADRFEIVDTAEKRVAVFYKGTEIYEIEIPQHICKLPLITLESQTEKDISDSQFAQLYKAELTDTRFPIVQIRVACSKGTYIRTLAEDVGLALTPPIPAMLWQLRRTRIGDISIDQALQLDNLQSLIS